MEPADDYHVAIPDVRALSRGVALVCEVTGRRVAIPLSAIAPSSRVQKAGDVGTLLVALSVARRIGICAPGTRR